MSIMHTAAIRMREIKNSTIYFITGNNDETAIWCYLSVPSKKDSIFQRALKSNIIDVAKYGTVLYSGDGIEPPELIKQMVENFNQP